MTAQIRREIERLKPFILRLGASVEEMVHSAIKAVLERNRTLAAQVVAADDEIDMREIEIEEECLKVLALYHPVAIDLRFIVSVLKINSDLERIADIASNIASRAIGLCDNPPLQHFFDLEEMSMHTRKMLSQSLQCLVNLDSAMAQQVIASDSIVDKLHRGMYQAVQGEIVKNPKMVTVLIQVLSVSRGLERIADLTTNVAEDVIYMAEGGIARHRREHRK